MILPKVRDPRLVTIRRGGRLTDTDHRLIALWAATRAEHVLSLFERAVPDDPRPRQAIGAARAWVRGELPMMATRAPGGHAMGAARPLGGAARFAAYAAEQAACVAGRTRESHAGSNAPGSAPNSPHRSVTSSSMTSNATTTSAGRSSTTERRHHAVHVARTT